MRRQFAFLGAGCLTLGLMALLGSAQADKSSRPSTPAIPYPGADQDLVRVDMKVSATSSPVENFTIAFDKAASGCTLRMEWETSRATVDISKM